MNNQSNLLKPQSDSRDKRDQRDKSYKSETRPQRDGASLYSLLTSLGCPQAASLSPEALEWVAEAPG